MATSILYAPEEVIVRGGRIDAAFGSNEVVFRDGEYHLSVSLRDRPIAMNLRLRPVTMPSLANNIQLDPGPPINWMVVPRLLASGTVTVAGRRHELRNAPAYHDHNWGHFAWGRDFAWEWGFGLPQHEEAPWSMVFVRLSDRAHTRALMQALFLWKGIRQHRVFRARDIEIRHEGHLRPARIFKIPRPMALLSPDLLPDVPRHLHVHAEADGDHLECVFDARDGAQVILPNDHDSSGSPSSTRSAAPCASPARCGAKPYPWRVVQSSSSSVSDASFTSFLGRSLELLARELPWAYAAMCRTLAPREVSIEVDGETTTVMCGVDAVRIAASGKAPEVECRTTIRAILDLVDAKTTLVEAVAEDWVWLRGRPEDSAGVPRWVDGVPRGGGEESLFSSVVAGVSSVGKSRRYRAEGHGTTLEC